MIGFDRGIQGKKEIAFLVMYVEFDSAKPWCTCSVGNALLNFVILSLDFWIGPKMLLHWPRSYLTLTIN